MIEFHGDRLVPPELCTLLYRAVPKCAHVPVRFFNRHDAHGEPTSREPRGYSASFGIFRHVKRPWIGVNLNAVFFTATGYLHPHLARSTAVWRALLDTCLHEFGHSATREITERLNRYEYWISWGRVHRRTEQLAEDWKDVRLERILRHDPRLGQPRRITGYLAALLARHRVELKESICPSSEVRVTPSVRASYFKEQRCWKAGAQLTSGDVLREAGLEPDHFTNAYRVLRRASDGIGLDYMDGAGRRHKLYSWGDVPILKMRMQDRLDELVFRPEPADPGGYWASDDGESYVNPDSTEVVWFEGDVERDDTDAPF